MSIVMNCQYCGQIDACHDHKVEDESKPVWICDGCAEESTKCSSCGVIAEYYEYDEMGFIVCLDCMEAGK